MGHKLAVAMIFLLVSSAGGQTSSELEKKYGKPVISYLVSENILMTPEYTFDGQVCMMRLHPRHFGPDTDYISAKLPFRELTKVLNELIPPDIRGAKKEPFDTGAAGGGAEWMSYAYENVKVSFSASFRPEPDSWKTRKEYVFTIKPDDPALAQPPKPKTSTPSDNDFSSSQLMRTEMVTIRWNGRKCAK